MALRTLKPNHPRWKRWAIKSLAFGALTFLVLNPNLKRLALQVPHTLAPESLIQTNFVGLGTLNRQIDGLMARFPGRSEVKVVEQFVLKRVRYVSDYETWGNLEYWPTAAEVWEKRQEDCDGRAILAASILRSRGYQSARLAISLDHMWIRVNARERQSAGPEELTSILHPDERFSATLEGRPSANQVARLTKAFLRPTALRDTSANLLAGIPLARKAILLTALLLLCYHPRRSWKGLLPLLCLECVALSFFAVSDARKVDPTHASVGLTLVVLAIGWSWFAGRIARVSWLLGSKGERAVNEPMGGAYVP